MSQQDSSGDLGLFVTFRILFDAPRGGRSFSAAFEGTLWKSFSPIAAPDLPAPGRISIVGARRL
jgi:hypothetical protein